MYDVAFDESPAKAARILQKLLLYVVSKGRYSVPMRADKMIRTACSWCARITPQIAQQAVGGLARLAAEKLEVVDNIVSTQLVRISRLILQWTSQCEGLEEQGRCLQIACDRVMSLEAELDTLRTAGRGSAPSLELIHLRDAAANERNALQKCLDDVEEKLGASQAEVLKTSRGNNLVQARLTDAMDNAHKVQQQNEKLREELVQLETFKSSRSGAIIAELERQLAETRMALAQAEEDNDNLEFELSDYKEQPERMSINLDGYSNASSPPRYDVSPLA